MKAELTLSKLSKVKDELTHRFTFTEPTSLKSL